MNADLSKIQVGVIGAGLMGVGVAASFAIAGYEVILVDNSSDALEKAKDKIRDEISFRVLFSVKDNSINIDESLSRITYTMHLKDTSKANLIVENVSEDKEIKNAVHLELAKTVSPIAKIVVNTSCLLITQLAEKYNKPENIIGVHFMNPVSAIDTVEVIIAKQTSDDTLRGVEEYLKSIGKKSIIVKDSPGFVSNRISHLFMNEAIRTLQDDIASAEKIDAIFEKCYLHKMGPLKTADLIGLDTVKKSLDVLYHYYKEEKFKSAPLLCQLVEEGKLGRKTGQGFYKY